MGAEGAGGGLFPTQMCVSGGGENRAPGPLQPQASSSRLLQAAQLEAARAPRLRYLLVVSTREGLSRDETVLLGVDFPDSRWEQGEEEQEGLSGRRWC